MIRGPDGNALCLREIIIGGAVDPDEITLLEWFDTLNWTEQAWHALRKASKALSRDNAYEHLEVQKEIDDLLAAADESRVTAALPAPSDATPSAPP